VVHAQVRAELNGFLIMKHSSLPEAVTAGD
jgi:hypothetical protein